MLYKYVASKHAGPVVNPFPDCEACMERSTFQAQTEAGALQAETRLQRLALRRWISAGLKMRDRARWSEARGMRTHVVAFKCYMINDRHIAWEMTHKWLRSQT